MHRVSRVIVVSFITLAMSTVALAQEPPPSPALQQSPVLTFLMGLLVFLFLALLLLCVMVIRTPSGEVAKFVIAAWTTPIGLVLGLLIQQAKVETLQGDVHTLQADVQIKQAALQAHAMEAVRAEQEMEQIRTILKQKDLSDAVALSNKVTQRLQVIAPKK